MLILTRKLGERILIGDDIVVRLVRVDANSVRIGIEAPHDVRILRAELRPFDDPSASEADIATANIDRQAS